MNKHRSLSILISDADKTVQHTIGGYLSLNGHQVDFADSSSGLLDRVDASDYDFALVDIALPGLSTFDLLSGIWKLRPDLPVIFMAAPNKLYLEMGIKAFRSGATDVLIKPVKIPEVDALLESFAPSSLSDTDEGSATSQLIGISAPISQVREHIRRSWRLIARLFLLREKPEQAKRSSLRRSIVRPMLKRPIYRSELPCIDPNFDGKRAFRIGERLFHQRHGEPKRVL